MGNRKISSSIQRYAALVGAVIIALGFLPIPLTVPPQAQAIWFVWLIVVSPLFPLALLAVSFVSGRKLPVKFAVAFAVVVLGVGIFVTLILSAFAGGGARMAMLHGTALTIACAATFLLVSSVGPKARLLAARAFAFSVFVGLWSLVAVPLAYASAVKSASGKAYCIGHHSPIPSELAAIQGLRGLFFYTKLSGYKSTSEWYFHGLLLVEEDAGISVYNWSPRRLQFQAVERPQLLTASPFHACVPRHNFLHEIDLF